MSLLSQKGFVVFVVLSIFVYAGSNLCLADGQYFQSKDVKIHYVIKGKGEPVVLIHGMDNYIDVMWGETGYIDALAEKFQVIALDLRGHGKSDKPSHYLDYGLEMVKDVLRLLDHLKIEKAHFVGYSLGSAITLKLITTYLDRAISAVAGGCAWFKPAQWDILKQFEEDAQAHEKGEGFGMDKGKFNKKLGKQISGTQKDYYLAMAGVKRGLKELTIAELSLKKNNVPCLLLMGSDDPVGEILTDFDATTKVMANSKSIEFQGKDHLTTIFDNPGFIIEIEKFLSEHTLIQSSKSDKP